MSAAAARPAFYRKHGTVTYDVRHSGLALRAPRNDER